MEKTKYVRGLQGIAEFFGVSLPTARKFEATWLAPAIIRVGKIRYMEKEKAMELFEAHRGQ